MGSDHEAEGQQFEWDDEKAARNVAKHGVTFHEAATVFTDAMALLYADEVHSENERRYIAIGRSNLGRVLVVSFTERESGDIVRIISSREATGNEGKEYLERSV